MKKALLLFSLLFACNIVTAQTFTLSERVEYLIKSEFRNKIGATIAFIGNVKVDTVSVSISQDKALMAFAHLSAKYKSKCGIPKYDDSFNRESIKKIIENNDNLYDGDRIHNFYMLLKYDSLYNSRYNSLKECPYGLSTTARYVIKYDSGSIKEMKTEFVIDFEVTEIIMMNHIK